MKIPADQPKEHGSYRCTAERPYLPSYTGGPWHHPDSLSSDVYGGLAEGGSYRRLNCPHCNLRLNEQLPD